MTKMLELKGKLLGHLKVLGKVRRAKGQPQKWRVLCTGCGKRLTVLHSRLTHAQSPKTHCGCQNKGLPSHYPLTYRCWYAMIQRCHNPKAAGYEVYGAKGIYVHEEWRCKKTGLQKFIDHVGPRPSTKYSLDRIDPHGSYVPGNVQWATAAEQVRNRKITKYVEHPKTGEILPAGEVAEDLKMDYRKFRLMMIKRGKWNDH